MAVKNNIIKIPGFDLYLDIALYNFNQEHRATLEDNFRRGCRNIYLDK